VMCELANAGAHVYRVGDSLDRDGRIVAVCGSVSKLAVLVPAPALDLSVGQPSAGVRVTGADCGYLPQPGDQNGSLAAVVVPAGVVRVRAPALDLVGSKGRRS